RLRMPHIRLKRRQRTKTRTTTPTKRLRQGIHLNRVTQPRPRTMRDQITHRTRIHPRPLIHITQQPNLSRTTGRRNPIRPTVIINPTTQHRRIPTKTPRLSIRLPLQHHHRNSLARNHPIRPPIKRTADPLGGEHFRPGHSVVAAGVGQDVRAGDNRGVTLTRPQAQTRLMQRHQPRRTRRINRHIRTRQIQEIRQPRGENGSAVCAQSATVSPHVRVVAFLGADEDPDPFTGQLIRTTPRVLQRPPHLLQQQPLPRVHHLRLARRHLKEQRIKLSDPRHRTQTPPAVRGGPQSLTLRRDNTGLAPALGQHTPQLIHRTRTREPTTHPHHRDRPTTNRRRLTTHTRTPHHRGNTPRPRLPTTHSSGTTHSGSTHSGTPPAIKLLQHRAVLIQHKARQHLQRRITENHIRRQITTNTPPQHPRQLHQTDRVKPVITQTRRIIQPIHRQLQQLPNNITQLPRQTLPDRPPSHLGTTPHPRRAPTN